MRRTIALHITAALALSLAFVFPGQAVAQEEPPDEDGRLTVKVTQPGPGPHAGNVPVKVEIEETYSQTNPLRAIRSYTIELVGLGVFCETVYDDEKLKNASHTVTFTWNTNRYPTSSVANCDTGPTLPNGGAALPNGTYTIKATATLTQPPALPPVSGSGSATVKIRNGVATPSGVKLAYNSKKDDITVSWKANSEVDLSGYRVEECIVSRSSKPCDGEWDVLTDTAANTTAITVKTAGAGIYRYRVAAMRPDENGTANAVISGWATPQGDPTEIVVEEKPAPTTTTVPEEDEEGEADEEVAPEPVEPAEPRPVVLPRRVERAAPQVVQRVTQEDTRPFEETLPYERANGDEEAISGRALAGTESGGDQRAVLIPLAGGMLLLIFAGQLWYLNRRAGLALEPVPVDDFGDGIPFDRA